MYIQECARQTDLPPRSIRCYEEIGLLPWPRRPANGYRDCDEADVTRARLVAGARRLDVALDDIWRILDLRDRHIAPCRTVLDLLTLRSAVALPNCSALKLNVVNCIARGKPFPRMMSTAKTVSAIL